LGTLSPAAPFDDKSPNGAILVRVLAERGYTLGQNLTFDARGAVGQIGKLPALLQELKVNKVDAIVAIGYPTALAVKSTDIPTVVAFGAGDPVATGLVV
jgi:putative tryptophan/tyrosine transport system substrate-binding protein